MLPTDEMNFDGKVALAEQWVAQNQLQEARELCLSLLDIDPDCAKALHTLGVSYLKQNQIQAALPYLKKAVELSPNLAFYQSNLSFTYLQLGQLELAIAHGQQAIRLEPNFAGGYNNLALACHESGRYDEAIYGFQQALTLDPNYAVAHHNLSRSLRLAKRFDEAIAHAQRAVTLNPNYAEAWGNLGDIYMDRQLWNEAIAAFQKVIALEPTRAAPYNNLAMIAFSCGRLEETLQYGQQALARNPNLDKVHFVMGVVYGEYGALQQAMQHQQQAIQINPNNADAYHALGNAYVSLSQFDLARIPYEKAIALRPNEPLFLLALANLYANAGEMEPTLKLMAQAEVLSPDDGGIRLKDALLLPVIYDDLQMIAHWRERYHQSIQALLADPPKVNSLMGYLRGSPSFYLAYQNGLDKPVLSDLARLFGAMVPQREAVLSPNPKPKIGFLSRLFTARHTIGKLMLGIINQLSRDQFDVVVLHIGQLDHSEISAVFEAVPLPYVNLERTQDIIARQNLDVLFYADIGMDPLSYLLAFSRLARVQCVTWGHPLTSGVPTIDYFISSKLIEPEEGQEHYTEKLVCLESLPTYYARPEVVALTKSRKELGLPESGGLYFCPQSLFKFHPDFDAILKAILHQDPQGHILLMGGNYAQWETLLFNRFARTIPEDYQRIKLLQRLAREDFLQLMTTCDVMLDTPYFGGGNTNYEAFAVGLPVVTMPGAYMRGRVALGCYRKMGILDCIAETPEAYAALAVRFGTEPAFRQAIKEKILAANHCLFEDKQVIAELESFFIQALAQQKTVALQAP